VSEAVRLPLLRVEVALAPVPMSFDQLEAWLDRYLEYILERRPPPSLPTPEVAA